MERWDLLDEHGAPTGQTMVRGDRLQKGQYHLVVHIWIVDRAGRLLIQKRALDLRLMPGMWAVTGGSAIVGEDGVTAARRELREELGIETRPGELEPIGTMRRRNSFCQLWLLRRDVPLHELRLQAEEVAAARWVEVGELRAMVTDHTFHDYGKAYFDMVFAYLYPEGESV